ncbi:MAG: hypothetical protein K2L97_05370 [Muribaculaceae bacterium]|nr:hypothetical protein [Muribaculaceae bacterium]
MIMWYGDEGYYDDKGPVYIENKTFTFDNYTYVWAADKYPYEVVFGSQVEPGYDPAGWWAANGD